MKKINFFLKNISFSLVFFSSLICAQSNDNFKQQLSQEVKIKLDSLNNLFIKNQKKIDQKKSLIENYLSNVEANLNIERDSILLLKKINLRICESQKSYKEIFKDEINSDSIEVWFDSKKCEVIINEPLIQQTNKPFFDNEFLMTNAINFDFNETSKSSTGYFGHINYFFNVKNKNREPTNFYINTGIWKVNYYSSTLNKIGEHQYDLVRLSPLDTSNQYIKMYNQYDYTVKLNSYSGYFQVMRSYFESKNIFLHAHGEIMITNVNTDLKITTIEKDTLTNNNNEQLTLLDRSPENQSTDEQSVSGYFGLGLTGKYFFFKNRLNYFVQGTLGYSVTQFNPKLLSKIEELQQYKAPKNWDPFFLIHTYFDNDISGIHVILGSQIRGNFKSAPFYTFYIGINLSLEKLGALLKQ